MSGGYDCGVMDEGDVEGNCSVIIAEGDGGGFVEDGDGSGNEEIYEGVRLYVFSETFERLWCVAENMRLGSAFRQFTDGTRSFSVGNARQR